MFIKLVNLIVLCTYLAVDARVILQDIESDLTNVKEKLAKVESKLSDMKTDISEMQERLENVDTVKEPTTACQDGWMTYKRSCYFFGTTVVTFTVAKERCRSLDAHLVYVENQDENNFLKAFMLSHDHKYIYYWIGITDEDTENDWKLAEGNTVATFFDWGSTYEPKGGTAENCAIFASGYRYSWADVDCYGINRYLCEKNANWS